MLCAMKSYEVRTNMLVPVSIPVAADEMGQCSMCGVRLIVDALIELDEGYFLCPGCLEKYEHV